MKFKEIDIKRVIIHKIIGKTTKNDAYTEASTDLHNLDPDTKATLLERIESAISKSKRFFETSVENMETDSFYDYAKNLSKTDKKDFLDKSVLIAELAAAAHQKRTQPGGLLIVIDASLDKLSSVIVIKAELQQALIINGKAVELIKELFLSPAKEFFKIGILIHHDPRSMEKKSFDSYVYDDNFTAQKNDLATYFYRDFLGFSTHENDKLRTNNFIKEFSDFVDGNVKDFESRRLLKTKIKADYRESAVDIVDPASYTEYFEKDGLVTQYHTKVLSKFPRSFSKDLSLVDAALQKSSLQITSQLKISGPPDLVENLQIINPNQETKLRSLIAQIESRDVARLVVIKTDALNPSFYRDDENTE
ncbi:hypothetical protein GCM10022246_26220 [Pedobacter ginsengiterrae]|uniref:Nucleoid-associated protein n=1 Tax=Pedobacter ginsengiterrae TaxID=871696 RepID=A0ABP7PWP1_9SPHI